MAAWIEHEDQILVSTFPDGSISLVGGRLKFSETTLEGIQREVLEETGTQMEIDRLGFVHENYFYLDEPGRENQVVYEISFYFYMKMPPAFSSFMHVALKGIMLFWV